MRLILPSYLIVSDIIFITVLPNVSASGALSGLRGPTPYTPREVAAIKEESFIYLSDNRSVHFIINRHTHRHTPRGIIGVNGVDRHADRQVDKPTDKTDGQKGRYTDERIGTQIGGWAYIQMGG